MTSGGLAAFVGLNVQSLRGLHHEMHGRLILIQGEENTNLTRLTFFPVSLVTSAPGGLQTLLLHHFFREKAAGFLLLSCCFFSY